MKWLWVQTLLPIILPLIVGYLSSGSMQYLKRLSGWVDTLPTGVKPLVVFAIATAITIATKAFGLEIDTTTLSGLSSTDIQSILGGLVAIALHNSKKLEWTQNVATTGMVTTDVTGPTYKPTATDKL